METLASVALLGPLWALALGAPAPAGPSSSPSLWPGLALELAGAPPAVRGPTAGPSGPRLELAAAPPVGPTGPRLRSALALPETEGGAGAGPTAPEASAPSAGAGSALEQLAEIGRGRARLRTTHHVLGIVTWASALLSATLGTVQFVDSYGADELAETRCRRGEPLMGEWNCGVPVLHLSYVFLTTAVYFTTFGLGRAVREQSGELGQGGYSRRRRAHRALAWTHLAGVAYQIVGGLVFANLGAMGLDEEESFRLRQGLFASHLVVGWLTFGALTGSWVSMAGT